MPKRDGAADVGVAAGDVMRGGHRSDLEPYGVHKADPRSVRTTDALAIALQEGRMEIARF